MKVILLEDVTALGKQGSVVDVNDGYARNYLIPRGMAEEAKASALRKLELKKSRWQKIEAKDLAEAKKIADQLSGKVLQMTADAGESGKLYGSITAHHIAEKLATEWNVALDKRKVQIEEPIRSLGFHRVPLKLHRDLVIELELEVIVKE
ncbi:MAG: 50S ribosomal protein L9 [bacterium]|nr:50S ribosomal protein L9 [Coprothermobacterota bacterium]